MSLPKMPKMSFNEFMHPRNPFKNKPNYKVLAEKYPEFAEYLVPYASNKKFKIDFNDPNALRCLSTVLLRDQFDLKVNIPLDRLIPSIPQRVNYVLWLEDLVRACFDGQDTVKLIDCGTGASCVFPLISTRLNRNWSFIATELDDYSLEYARQNCETNQLADRIKVIKGRPDQLVPDLVDSEEFHALMCNPPFFEQREDEGRQSGSNTSTLVEATVDGGEESFVSKLIDESFVYRNKVKLFTVMLGRKASLKSLKKRLQGHREDNVLNFVGTEFCQGKTIRWGLAWTFDLSLNLRSVQKIDHAKKNPTFVHSVPEERFLTRYCYTLNGVTECILELLDDIQIGKSHISGLTKTKQKIEFTIKTNLNTWSHQRRRRRLAQRMNEQAESGDAKSEPMEQETRPTKRRLDDLELSMNNSGSSEVGPSSPSDCGSAEGPNENVKRVRTESEVDDGDEESYLLNCKLKVQREKEVFYLKITANDRIKDKDSAHQLFQYFKNNLT